MVKFLRLACGHSRVFPQEVFSVNVVKGWSPRPLKTSNRKECLENPFPSRDRRVCGTARLWFFRRTRKKGGKRVCRACRQVEEERRSAERVRQSLGWDFDPCARTGRIMLLHPESMPRVMSKEQNPRCHTENAYVCSISARRLFLWLPEY